YPTVKGTMRANRAEIPVWTVNDLDVDAAQLGLKGSPTQVRKIFTPKQRTQGVLIQKDTAREAVAELIAKLAEAKIV
ncbi:MAG TPA: electron transfer flavoprotein subunit beta, partial [Negativicutes bacterium]|nr:electron transfer flavoprotein subunit beta [Negativicutes bacterium]